jgi:NAD(P)H-hydrate epimerase
VGITSNNNQLLPLTKSTPVYKIHPPSRGKNILLACGPGNNGILLPLPFLSHPHTLPTHTVTGGDGLVCARHLHHYGYSPKIYYPKPTNAAIFNNLQKQLRHIHIPFLTSVEEFTSELQQTDLVVDALFGFSFKPPVRPPFDEVLNAIIQAKKPVLSIDTPSSWNVDDGPPEKGQVGSDFMPEYLISLTAAKPSVKYFKGKRHFIGGRFLSQDVARKYGLDVPEYLGLDQIAEVDVGMPLEKL